MKEPQSPQERDKARRAKRQAARNEEARSVTTSALVTGIALCAGNRHLNSEEVLHLNACRTELDRRIPAEPPFKPWTDEERAVLEAYRWSEEKVCAKQVAVEEAERLARRAEAQLAALREAALNVRGGIDVSDQGGVGLWFATVNDLDKVLADTEAAAEDYKRRIRVEALKSVAELWAIETSVNNNEWVGVVERWLLARAAEIQGGR